MHSGIRLIPKKCPTKLASPEFRYLESFKKITYLTEMKCVGLLILGLISNEVAGQHIGSVLPKRIDSKERFLFYQHGGVVTIKGNNAITDAAPEWGP